MRPYKKRSFHSRLQSSENNMEAENSEDSEKQASSSSPIEDMEKDKEKGETKRRKKWKRKISRKQFRHHDIKIFAPGEYKSTSLLKQTESSPTIPKKADVPSKESITDLIVTTLGGQKQKKSQAEEGADSTTKNDVEENNNTNGIQNNNIGKHHLPAIIMEMPSIRRRSVDNTNIPKSNFTSIDKFDRRMSVDMPLLYLQENHEAQPQMTDSRLEHIKINNTESRIDAEERTHGKNINGKDFSEVDITKYSVEHVSKDTIHNLNHTEAPNHISMEQNYLMQNSNNNSHVEENYSLQRLQEQNLQPMETSTEEQSVEPENLSLKRRYSVGETPVDLSKKSTEHVDQQSNRHNYKSRQNGDTERMSFGTKNSTGNCYSLSNYQHQTTNGNSPVVVSSSQNTYTTGEYVRNNVANHASTSPEVLHPIIPYLKENEPQDQTLTIPDSILRDTINKITNLNMWQEFLHRMIKQPFTIQILDLLAHAYEQIDRAQSESCIHSDMRLKAQKLLSEAYNFISGKLKQLNLDVNPAFVIKTLGQAENTTEKTTLKHYMENIEDIKKLAIDEARSIVLKVPPTQFPSTTSYLKSYRELARSPTSPHSAHIIKQLPYRRNSRDSHLSGEPSSQTNNHSLPVGYSQSSGHTSVGYSSPLGHQSGQSSRAVDHNMSPGYLRGSPPKTGNHPISGGQSRETSPRIGDQPITMKITQRNGDYSNPQRRSKGPSPIANDHLMSSEMPQRVAAIPQGHSREQSPKTGGHQMPMEISLRNENYSVPQRRSRGPSPQTNDHHVPTGLPQRIGEYNFPQGHPRGPSPKIVDHPLPYGHHVGQPTAEYPVPQRNSRVMSPRTGDHSLFLGHPGGSFLRPMQQGVPQRAPPRSDVPLDHTNEPPLRTGNQFLAPGFPERHAARSSDHSLPLGYPRELQFQHPGPHNMSYVPNKLNINPFLSQASHKVLTTSSSGMVGRPRSKSHRNVDTKNGYQQLRRSLSNPQHAAMENYLLAHPYLEGPNNRMSLPMVPTSTHNFHPSLQPNNNLPPQLPNLVHNKELSITQSTAAPSKSTVPTLYSDVFYRSHQKQVSKENPLSVSVHPHLRSHQKKVPDMQPNIYSLENNQSQKEMPNVKEVHQKVPKEHHRTREPLMPLVRSPTEEKISSSTDHVEISKVGNVTKKSLHEKEPMANSISPKPLDTLKSIPVAVIVADHSMQITKETKSTSDKGQRQETPKDVTKDTDTRMSVSSNDNMSSSEENLRHAFDKEQEENNSEFLVWLEKLKSNEKLKSRFLSQMGIIKKEEPLFTVGGDPIEIVDSDEEDASQTEKRIARDENLPSVKEPTSDSPQESVTIEPLKEYVPYKPPPQTVEINKISAEQKASEVIRNPSPKKSLSKKDYIPPIPLPYVPISTGQKLSYPSTPIEQTKKGIYSPQIEPISPVGNEASFVFPDVTNEPKLHSPLNLNPSDRSTSFTDSVTSPTYHKRKNPLDFPAYQNEDSRNTKTNYTNDNSKRRKSLERPELSRSPRTAPSGKLCYVRESHMFLRYFDDTQVELFIRNLSTQDEELLRSTGMEPGQFKSTHRPSSKFGTDQLAKTEIIYLPRDVEFSEKEDIPEVEEFIKETSLVEQFVPKDFADFYRYVTGFQIIKNKHPVSLQTFLTMYNTNRTSELLRKYLERDEVVSRKR